jgi:hypothetical protein
VSRARTALGAVVLVVALGAVGRAEAGGDAPPTMAARELAAQAFESAERAFRAGDFAEAKARYDETLRLDPSAPFARIAQVRAADLGARSEGGFGPLARLERVRRDARKSADPREIEALRDDLRSFPPGRVRSEARMLVAESLRHKLARPREAVALFEQIVDDPAADGLTKSLALSELVATLREVGQIDRAVAVLDAHPEMLPGLRAEVKRLARRETLRRMSQGTLALLGAIGVVAVARAARRVGDVRELPAALVRPLSLGFAAFLGGAAAVIARLRGDGDPRPFMLLGVGVFAVDVVARAWRIGGSNRPGSRALRASACALGVLAVAFVAIERTEASYLASFGL